MPFQGCGWYSQPLVEYGLKLRIIKRRDILYEFLPASTVPSTFFRKGIDYLLRIAGDDSIGKALVNSWVGLMNRTTHGKQISKYTQDYEEALTFFGRAHDILGIETGALKNKNDEDIDVHVERNG